MKQVSVSSRREERRVVDEETRIMRRSLARKCDACGKLRPWADIHCDQAKTGDPRPHVMMVCGTCLEARNLQRDVLALIQEGRSPVEIADLLGLEPFDFDASVSLSTAESS